MGGVSDRPVKLIEQTVDCVIRLGDQADSSLIARSLNTDAVVTCASPAYIAARGQPMSPQDLSANHDMIGSFSTGTGSHGLVFKNGQ